MHGYSEAEISLAVFKKLTNSRFATDQAAFMSYLGEDVCPKVLMVGDGSYCMEYLLPVEHHEDSLLAQERLLKDLVWVTKQNWGQGENEWRHIIRNKIGVEVPDWALEQPCVIHGDPTCDNVLMTKQGFIRITDPIPPLWLNKPSILAVDHGKLLQSFLGWETVLRGMPPIEFTWPEFMTRYDSAMRGVFWAMVAIKRIAYRDISTNITKWANRLGKELEEICAL